MLTALRSPLRDVEFFNPQVELLNNQWVTGRAGLPLHWKNASEGNERRSDREADPATSSIVRVDFTHTPIAIQSLLWSEHSGVHTAYSA